MFDVLSSIMDVMNNHVLHSSESMDDRSPKRNMRMSDRDDKMLIGVVCVFRFFCGLSYPRTDGWIGERLMVRYPFISVFLLRCGQVRCYCCWF